MFERLQKPFLTVETGEAYQPIRLTYDLHQKDKLMEILNALNCIEKNPHASTWNWFWRDECADLHFESIESFTKSLDRPLRLGTFTLRDNQLFLNLPSFKRACLAVPFFHKTLNSSVLQIKKADFINKVFGTDERLPHGFTELFKDEELDQIIHQRITDYEKVQAQCENAENPTEALTILSDYAKAEAQKRLPYAERYSFEEQTIDDPDVIFLGFYIYLRSRELVAIRRWYGQTGFTLSSATDEIVETVFGGMNIDVIE